MLVPQRRRLLFGDLDREFERFFRGTPAIRPTGAEQASEADWVPALDVEQTNDGLTLHLDVPGVAPEAVDVNVEDGMLVIRGERGAERTENKANYLRVERRHGKFVRRLQLPQWADVERIAAEGKHGEIRITIPRDERTKPRKIDIH